MKRVLVLGATHLFALVAGFALGVYCLPILTAPEAPSEAAVRAAATSASFEGQFRRDLRGSDPLHWGEGRVTVGPHAVALQGRIAPGPDYKLYLSPGFVETKAEFMQLKPQMLRVGDVKTFDNFIVPLPPGVDASRYDTVVVWCESFKQFISAAKYR